MLEAVDVKAELAGRPVLRERSPHTSAADTHAAFAVLAPFGNGSVFAGSFSGAGPWERHPNGDELVQVLAGSTTLTVMMDDGPESVALTAGMLSVVPRGRWHRFHAPDQVTVLTATPLPTEHSRAEDPRTAGS